MLIIVNPYATTVSDRLKNLVVYALQARYDVEAVDTEAAEHAIEIGREARHGGYDIVVAFGGDGTLNEVANGLAGTDVPVSVLPGGSTNVVCRTLGIPNDVVDATEHLIGARRRLPAPQDRPRPLQRPPLRLRLRGRAGRHGGQAGRRPSALKARARQWYYTWAAISGFYRHYLRNPVRSSSRSPERRTRASPRSRRTPTPSPTSPTSRSGSARTSASMTARSRWPCSIAPSSATCCRSPLGS